MLEFDLNTIDATSKRSKDKSKPVVREVCPQCRGFGKVTVWAVKHIGEGDLGWQEVEQLPCPNCNGSIWTFKRRDYWNLPSNLRLT